MQMDNCWALPLEGRQIDEYDNDIFGPTMTTHEPKTKVFANHPVLSDMVKKVSEGIRHQRVNSNYKQTYWVFKESKEVKS